MARQGQGALERTTGQGERPAPAHAALTWNALAFALGVGLYFLQPRIPPGWPVVAAVLAAAGLSLRYRRMWPVVSCLAGFGWSQLACQGLLSAPFPEGLVRQDLVIEGRVASLPERGGDGVRFLLDPEAVWHGDQRVRFGGLVRLSWYRDPPELLAGQRWRLAVRLKPPHGFVNRGGFDYERWLFLQGVGASGHVLARDQNRLLDAGAGRYRLLRWRQRLRDRLTAALAGLGSPDRGAGTDGRAGSGRDSAVAGAVKTSPAGALVSALVVGDRGGLTPAQWRVFAQTGTSHLIAISGLHVGLVAGFVFVLARWLWSRGTRLVQWLAAPRAAALVALAAAVLYSALAGFSVSTQRALIMLAVVLLALVAGRTLRPFGALLTALVAVLLVDPTSVLSFGFWLSFGAVAVLLYALGGRLAPAPLLWRWGRAQWAVALGLLPMLLLFFGRASVVAPAVNLVAVPLFGVILPVVLVAALVALAGWYLPLVLVGQGLDAGYRFLAWIARSPMAAEAISGRPDWVWIAAFAGVLLLLAPRGLPARWPGLVLLLPLALVRPPVPEPGQADFTLLDVGQGLAVVIRTASHVLVYDLGPRYPSGFNTGSAVLLPYLRTVGVEHLDVLMVSHADRDHAGGLPGLVAEMPVERILSGEPEAIATELPAMPGQTPGAAPAPCRRGQHWTWDGVEFEVLYPLADAEQGNDSSCVLRVNAGGASVLLTGDISRRVEARLVALDGRRLSSDLLVAAHHGSNTSSSLAFIAAVAPRVVLYSAGYANRFGFPTAKVRARFDAAGVRPLNTADSGEIRFLLGPPARVDGPVSGRVVDARLWRHRPPPGPDGG